MIQPVKFAKSLYYANKSFEAKAEKPLVNISYELEEDVFKKIASQYDRMEYVARVCQSKFRFVPKGDSVLANFGTMTSVFKNSAAKEEVISVIDGLIKKATSFLR